MQHTRLGRKIIIIIISNILFIKITWCFTVGKPIDVPKIPNPTAEDIDKYHKIFVDELTKLFEEHKTKYSKNQEELNLVLD